MDIELLWWIHVAAVCIVYFQQTLSKWASQYERSVWGITWTTEDWIDSRPSMVRNNQGQIKEMRKCPLDQFSSETQHLDIIIIQCLWWSAVIIVHVCMMLYKMGI